MPDLSTLLHDTATDDIEDVTIPEGYWAGVIKSGKLYDKDSDGQALVDKNGDEYARAVLFIECREPVDGVDQAAADAYIEAGGPRETLARYNKFIRGRRDVKRLSEMLDELGALTTARSIDKILEDLKGAEIPVKVLVEHEEYNDDIQTNATELAAP